MKLMRTKFNFLFAAVLLLQTHQLYAQKLQDGRLSEVSGLVVSSKNDDLIWVHNDSGDTGRIFLINKNGETQAVYVFADQVIDCEAIAIGTSVNGLKEIFVGDIGDNDAKRPYISIYKFPEPTINIKNNKETALKKVEELKFRYPDGARDAECLMIDPIDQKIYIVSKRENAVGVYSAPLNSKAGKLITLKKETTLFFNAPKSAKWITDGNISMDGKSIMIKSYINIYYWKRRGNETLTQCLKQKLIGLPYQPEPQGEALGFTHDAKHYYSISEGQYAEINYKSIK
jgi:hypothetical protein